MPVAEERLAFSLVLLANAADAPKPLSACEYGHLKVSNNTCWKPIAYSAELKTLIHEAVESCDG